MSFTKNRDRLIEAKVARKLLGPRPQPDGELARRETQQRDACGAAGPGGEAVLQGKGQTAKLNCMGHVLMDRREGLIVDVEVTEATGNAEREAALTLLDRLPPESAARWRVTRRTTRSSLSPTAASAV